MLSLLYDGEIKMCIGYLNKHQSNLLKRGIAPRFYSPGGSSNLQLHGSAGGSTLNLPFSWGPETPSDTVCRWAPEEYFAKWHLNPSNGFSRCMNVTDDKQTDRQIDDAMRNV